MEFILPDGFTEITPLPPGLKILGPYYGNGANVIGYRPTFHHIRGKEGNVSGGVILNLCDFAIGSVIANQVYGPSPDAVNFTTVNTSVDFISSPKFNTWLETEVDVLKIGRTLAFGQCVVKCGDTVICRANSTLALIGTRANDHSI